MKTRTDMGQFLNSLGLTGIGAEIGVITLNQIRDRISLDSPRNS